MEWVRTFDFSASPAELWTAIAGADPEQTWSIRPPRSDDSEGRTIAWADTDDDIGIEMSMRLTVTETETGSRVTITRSGFGNGDTFEVRQTSKLVAWREAMHDLAVYLQSGLDLRRLYEERSATGIQFAEVLGGLRVTATRPNSFGAAAGLEVGDLVVRLGGVPVFDRTDLWLLQRRLAPGEDVEVQFVRGTQLRTASAPMSDMALWATGELGGAPAEADAEV